MLEGTLAFIDISGFTRLTETLAARGKAGAEELTGFLDVTFAELLAIAYANGGELIKWGVTPCWCGSPARPTPSVPSTPRGGCSRRWGASAG